MLNEDTLQLAPHASSAEYDQEPYKSRNRDQQILPGRQSSKLSAVFIHNVVCRIGPEQYAF